MKIMKSSSMVTRMLLKWFPMDIIYIILDFSFNLEKRRFDNINNMMKSKELYYLQLKRLCNICYDVSRSYLICIKCDKTLCEKCSNICPIDNSTYCYDHYCIECYSCIKCKKPTHGYECPECSVHIMCSECKDHHNCQLDIEEYSEYIYKENVVYYTGSPKTVLKYMRELGINITTSGDMLRFTYGMSIFLIYQDDIENEVPHIAFIHKLIRTLEVPNFENSKLDKLCRSLHEYHVKQQFRD
jgi:hypothetical protein